MPLPRNRQISLTDTPYYHCVSRCVRRAFLCGENKETGQNYEHRRQWVEDRLLFLATVFTIDLCAYAVMSNHTHVILHVDQIKAQKLTDKEVVQRWQKMHKPTLLVQRFMDCSSPQLTDEEFITLKSTISIYRKRLFDISWFMKELNEFIARQANTEDDCTGHFWEGRFKSQALLDEHALAACLVYVDLNPIRAQMAVSPETSNHTSIKRRINDAKRGAQPKEMMPFVGDPKLHQPKGLTFNLQEYIQLVELTAQSIHLGKRAKANIIGTPILSKLGFNEHQWNVLSQCFEMTFSISAGTVESLRRFQSHTKRKRMTGALVRL
ncbi:transposase [Aliiglaciecola litoralis]|uniref:Transposase n=1 Tax=Aliiglaciecola litoralis TaxID=582857 RepID=A0ABP3WRR9_9ALTE